MPRSKRGNKTRGGGNKKKSSQASNNVEVIDVDAVQTQEVTNQPRAQRGTGRNRGSSSSNGQTSRRRPTVVSLDVTYSSSDLEISDEEQENDEEYIPKSPLKFRIENDPFHNNTFSPHQIAQRGLLSDSDSDDVPVMRKLPPTEKRSTRKSKKKPKFSNNFDSDSDVDLFAIDFEQRKKNLLEEAMKIQEENNDNDSDSSKGEIKQSLIKNKGTQEDVILSSSSDELNLSHVITKTPVIPKNKRIKMSKKTREILNSTKNSSKDISIDRVSDVEIISDEDQYDDVTVKVCWMGKKTMKYVVNKKDKLITLYKNLAESNEISVGDIYLSFKDQRVDPVSTFEDLNPSIMDVIEAGIIATSKISTSRSSPRKKKTDPNIITLKVQNDNKKDNQFINIHKLDKMTILMSKYAELKKIPLTNLKFRFDGDELDPSDTPTTLDLDGGECIDVYEKS